MRANGLIERQIVVTEYQSHEDPTVVEVAAVPRCRRRPLERAISTAARILPIARLVCAVVTTLAALLYVVGGFWK